MSRNNFLLIINGPMGSGKSTLAKELQKTFYRTVLIEPDYIKYTISDYKNTSKRYNDDIANIILNNCEYFISNNFNVILDNSIEQDKYIKLLKNLARKTNKLFFVIQIKASVKTCFLRATSRKDINKINKVSLHKIKSKIYSSLKNEYKMADLVLNSENETINDSVKRVLEYINMKYEKK